MAQKDQIESFVRRLYRSGKRCYSRREILDAAEREISETEGFRHLFNDLPDHDYDQQALEDALASILVRRT